MKTLEFSKFFSKFFLSTPLSEYFQNFFAGYSLYKISFIDYLS